MTILHSLIAVVDVKSAELEVDLMLCKDRTTFQWVVKS